MKQIVVIMNLIAALKNIHSYMYMYINEYPLYLFIIWISILTYVCMYNLLKKSQLKLMYYIKFPTVRFMDLVGSNLQGRLVFEGLTNLDGIRQNGIKWSSLDEWRWVGEVEGRLKKRYLNNKATICVSCLQKPIFIRHLSRIFFF